MSLHATRVQQLLSSELAPLAPWLDDPGTVEVLVNPDNRLYADTASQGVVCVGTFDPTQLVTSLAGITGHLLHGGSPELSLTLPILERSYSGARVHILAPPLTGPSGYAVTVRKLRGVPFSLADDFVARGIMPPEAAELLRTAVRDCRNIVVVGETGVGKTALASALLGEIDPRARLLVLEDVPELRAESHHLVALTTSATHTLADLVRSTFRLRPDRIIIGEVRGAEAFSLLQAWLSGRGGLATCHALDARQALLRLELLISLAGVERSRLLVAHAVHLLAVMANRHAARRLAELVAVSGLVDGEYHLTTLYRAEP